MKGMDDKEFIFIGGLHRSGTSLLHKILAAHPSISGFSGTSVPEDEGQHLQTVIKPALAFGGPGKFVFDERSYMDENHPLATKKNAKEIFDQWCNHWDLSSKYLIEKSPPNIVRTRFLQKLFPKSKFIIVLRHPIAVAFATKKWCNSSTLSLLDHTLCAYEIFHNDMKMLKSFYVLRYEDVVSEPQSKVNEIFLYLGLSAYKLTQNVKNDVNEKYFMMWEEERRIFNRLPVAFEKRANQFGYSFRDYRNTLITRPYIS